MTSQISSGALGVVVVAFNSADVILDCLESLLGATPCDLRIVVVDNASTDDTLDVLESWAKGSAYAPAADLPIPLTPVAKPVALVPPGETCPPAPAVTVIKADLNGGFAGGVNIGLAQLAKDSEVSRFWILNPDSICAPEAPKALTLQDAGDFSLMGGRVIYLEDPDRIQIDGGLVNPKTGVTGNVHLGAPVDVPAPDPADMQFITGASMVASRAFYDHAGPMDETYFLYYEEVDWAYRRGERPLAYCPEAVVYHRAGTSIGSPTLHRIGSPFSQYFKHRGRMRFMRRHHRAGRLTAWAYSIAKAAQYILKGYPKEASALLRGAWDGSPPKEVKDRLAPAAQAVAFAKFKV